MKNILATVVLAWRNRLSVRRAAAPVQFQPFNYLLTIVTTAVH